MNHVLFYESGISLQFNAEKKPDEVLIRNSIGRIYYYIYHEALEWLFNDSLLLAKYESLEKKVPSFHKRLARTFADCSADTQKLSYGTISRLLYALHDARCKADYHLDHTVDESDFFSMLGTLESLKQESQKFNSNVFRIETNIKSENLNVLRTDVGSIAVIKRPTLRILD